MALGPAAIGTELPPVTVEVERGRLRLYAKAIGETNPIYTDLAAARDAGHPDLPVPPTFLFGLELERDELFGYLGELGVDRRRVLHGEQSFAYHDLAHAGDVLTAKPRITDVYHRRGGELTFLVKRTAVVRGDGSAVADLTCVIVIPDREGGAHGPARA